SILSSRRRHTRCLSDWSSDVCSSHLRVSGFPAKKRGKTRTPSGLDLDDAGPHSERKKTMPTGKALTIGLNAVDPNHYGGWSGDLNACEADAEDMASLGNLETTTLLTQNA